MRSRPKIALYEPRIPQNTGNIARTCAAFQLELNLIEPLGFSLEDKYLKRSGLDYWPLVNLRIHQNFDSFYEQLSPESRLIGLSKSAENSLSDFTFSENDILIYGREDIGLPSNVHTMCYKMLSIPMPGSCYEQKEGVRSLNLSVSVAGCSLTYTIQSEGKFFAKFSIKFIVSSHRGPSTFEEYSG